MNDLMCLIHRFFLGSLRWLRDLAIIIGGLFLILHPIIALGFNSRTCVASVLNLVAMFMVIMMYFMYIGLFLGKRRRADGRTFMVLRLIYMIVLSLTFWFFIQPMTYNIAANLFSSS